MESSTDTKLTLAELVASFDRVENASSLRDVVLRFVHQRGVKMVSYRAGPAQRAESRGLSTLADGWPQFWVDGWREKGFHRNDPLADLTAQLGRPFLWSKIPEEFDLTPQQQAYYDWYLECDIGDGLAMHVYGPDMRNASISMGFGRKALGLTREQIFELQSAMQVAHVRYCWLTEKQQRARVRLSPRETEVLRWIARGKSNTVIADLLGISRHSVDTMTRRIFGKLKVNDRMSAVIHALASGLLQVDGRSVN